MRYIICNFKIDIFFTFLSFFYIDLYSLFYSFVNDNKGGYQCTRYV